MKLATILRDKPLFNGLLQRFNAFTPVQQFSLYALAVLVFGLLVFFKLIAPLNASRLAAQQRLPQLEREYTLMQAQAIEIENLSKSGALATAGVPNSAAIAPPTLRPKLAFGIAAVTAQFGSTAVVTKTSETSLQLSQSGTTVAQFIDNTTALQAATGATLSDFSLKRDTATGLISVTAQLQAANK